MLDQPSPLLQQASSGRLPWYNKKGEPFEPYIVGIAGGSGSGKTSVASRIVKGLPWVVVLCMDSYYKSLSKGQLELAAKK